MRPFGRLLFALFDRDQEQLLEAADRHATTGDRAGQGLDVGAVQRAFAQLQIERGAATADLRLGGLALARSDRAHTDQHGQGLFEVVVSHCSLGEQLAHGFGRIVLRRQGIEHRAVDFRLQGRFAGRTGDRARHGFPGLQQREAAVQHSRPAFGSGQARRATHVQIAAEVLVDEVVPRLLAHDRVFDGFQKVHAFGAQVERVD